MADITDGTAVFRVGDKRIKALIDLIYPVGIVVPVTNDSTPEFTQYGTWEVIASGRTLQGADSSHKAGTTIAAGLPNIKGEIWQDYSKGQLGGIHGSQTSYSGALYFGTKKVTQSCSWDDYGDAKSIAFDASKSNSIYGKSTTVQPAAYVVKFWHRKA